MSVELTGVLVKIAWAVYCIPIAVIWQRTNKLHERIDAQCEKDAESLSKAVDKIMTEVKGVQLDHSQLRLSIAEHHLRREDVKEEISTQLKPLIESNERTQELLAKLIELVATNKRGS